MENVKKGWARISARSWGQGQTVGARIVLAHYAPRVRYDRAAPRVVVRIASEVDRSFVEQGAARAEVWTAHGWSVVHSIPGEVLSSAQSGRGAATLRTFEADHAELARVLSEVLSLPPIPAEYLLEEDATLREDGGTT